MMWSGYIGIFFKTAAWTSVDIQRSTFLLLIYVFENADSIAVDFMKLYGVF